MANGHIEDDWVAPATLTVATGAQRAIAAAAETADRIGGVATIAGADVSMKWRDQRGPVHAAIAPFGWPGGAPRPPAVATVVPRFPYVPGYLGFREVPALLAAWQALADRPDLVVVDGQGRAHPRRCGVATHLGVVLDVPTIGVAKSLLCGRVGGVVGPAVGDHAPVVDRGEVVAWALRTSPRGGPVYVSGGHRVSLETAAAWILRLAGGRRHALPIRLAHDAANARRRAAEAEAGAGGDDDQR